MKIANDRKVIPGIMVGTQKVIPILFSPHIQGLKLTVIDPEIDHRRSKRNRS